MRPADRLWGYTRPAKRALPKIPRPEPLLAAPPVALRAPCGATVFFRDLAGLRPAGPGTNGATALPPLLPERLQGRYVDAAARTAMRALRQNARWSVGRLARAFAAPRSLVIDAALAPAERARAAEELAQRMDAMRLGEKTGYVMRHWIRATRRAAW